MQHPVRSSLPRESSGRGDLVRLSVAATAATVTLAAVLTGAGLRLAPAETPADPAVLQVGSARSGQPLPASPPVALAIPALGIDTSRIVELRQAPSGAMEVPADAGTVGWFGTGGTPGEPGAAVLSAHTQLGYEQGTFDELHTLRPGDTVTVQRADETVVVFTVYRIERTDDVYTAAELATTHTTRPELRLLTWSGDSVPESTQERSIVVFTKLSGTRA